MPGQRPRLDFSNHFQPGRKLSQIGCQHGIAVAGGSRKGRDVAVGGNSFGENTPSRVQQVYGFPFARREMRSMVFDNAASILKVEYE